MLKEKDLLLALAANSPYENNFVKYSFHLNQKITKRDCKDNNLIYIYFLSIYTVIFKKTINNVFHDIKEGINHRLR